MQDSVMSSASKPGQQYSMTGRIRDLCSSFLRQQLQELFTHADDVLFDMADRANNNQAQNSLFEAMRELRLSQDNLHTSMQQKLQDAFSQLTQVTIGQDTDGTLVADRDSMTLVAADELEETVAITNMVHKTLGRDCDLLDALSMRLGHLYKRQLDNEQNPVGPRLLGRSFLDSLNLLGFCDMQVKLILLKLFERYVLEDIGILYADCNQVLVTAGVLPELPSRGVSRPATAKAQASIKPPQAVAVDSNQVSEHDPSLHTSTEVDLADIQALLQQLRHHQPSAALPTGVMPVSSSDLLRLLTHLQHHNSGQVTNGELLHTQIDSILQRASQQSSHTRVVNDLDKDTINLVSMLFEFILDDQSLPDSLKALIGRLQIPLLKVAVQDRSFFGSAGHPARRLLNELGSAALGWSGQDDTQRDKLYQKIEEVVQRLLSEFSDDPVIFSDLLEDFVTFFRIERRRSELVEQRVRDAEEGRARTEAARQHIEQALNQRLLGKTLPETLVKLLQDNWSQVLLLHHLKFGEQSSQWQYSLQVVDDLIWSISEHSSQEDAIRLRQLVPQLVGSLKLGFEEAALDPFTSALLFTELEVLHIQAFQRLKQKLTRPASQPTQPADSQPAQATSEPVALTPQELPEILQEKAEHLAEQEVPEPTMVEVRTAIALPTADKNVEDSEPEEQIELDEDDAGLAKVDRIRPGSWFELQQADGSTVRCKLSALIKATGRYIFVNRHGMKVLDKNRTSLALAFNRGQLRMLEDALLFDRALESVIGNLRRMKDQDN